MEKFTAFQSTVVVIPIDNIDTDQIIPARFLKTTSKTGLGEKLFYDWRYEADGTPKADFVLNSEMAQRSKVLLAGENFGCGSSREHAPWALTQYGFRAVISTSFADIFKGNALKNSLLPIVVPKEAHLYLFQALKADPAAQVSVNLSAQILALPGGQEVSFPVDAFSKHCLLEGVDELGYLLQQADAITEYESQRVFRLNTTSVTF